MNTNYCGVRQKFKGKFNDNRFSLLAPMCCLSQLFVLVQILGNTFVFYFTTALRYRRGCIGGEEERRGGGEKGRRCGCGRKGKERWKEGRRNR